MKLRILNFCIDHEERVIYLGDDNGNVRVVDFDLNLLDVSSRSLHSRGLFKIICDRDALYARDYYGNLLKWNKHTLGLEKFIVSEHYSDPQKQRRPVPSPSNGLVRHDDKLYATNASGEVCVFDKDSMRLEDIICITEDAICDSLNFEVEPYIYASDMLGMIHRYNRETRTTEFTDGTEGGISHVVVVDRKFDRLWQSSDSLCGFALADMKCRIFYRDQMTHDDVEDIKFSADYERVYIASFDHHVHVFANEERPREIDKHGPFKYQVTHIQLLDDGDIIYLTLESGEFIKYDTRRREIVRSIYGTDAIWAMEPLDDDRLLCAHEAGYATINEIGEGQFGEPEIRELVRSPNLGLRRLKRVQQVDDEHFVAASGSGKLACFRYDGKERWTVTVGSFLRDLVLNEDASRCLTVSENGRVVEVDVASGEVTGEIDLEKPLLSACYCEDFIVVSERAQYDPADNEYKSHLILLDKADLSIRERRPFIGHVKRFHHLKDGTLLGVGSPQVYATIFRERDLTPLKQFKDWLLNTPENAVIVGETVYVVSYNQQLNTFDKESETILDSQFSPEGLPKSVRAVGEDRLVLAGRGFLSVYDISERVPNLITTQYLDGLG